jgi:DNA-binding MarR family transcriptional regulator
MATRGLVAKKKCDSDGRGSIVVVTARGRREIDVAAPGHVEAVRRMFVDLLTADQLAMIGDVAEQVLANLDG